MTEQNQNALNEECDAKMTRKYKGKIKDGNLQIGDYRGGDPEVTNLRFLEKFDIQTLTLFISNDLSVKFKSSTLKKLNVFNFREYYQEYQQRLNLNVDDLELENLEVLDLQQNNLGNNQLNNLVKFKKLHTLDVSRNNVGLTIIHSVTSLTKLSMSKCKFKNIDLISSLVNLKELGLSFNRDFDRDFDLSPLYKLKSLTKLSMNDCELKNIDQIVQLTNLDVLEVSQNQLKTINQIYLLVNLKQLDISWHKQIDITPLKDLVGLIKLNISGCGLIQLNALKHLTNLQTLVLSSNPDIIITELQYLKNHKFLNLLYCNLVSVYVLRPLVNLEELDISGNEILYLDSHLNEMKRLETLRVENNRISDFSSLEKHSNYNNIDDDDRRCFNISDQKDPSQKQLRKAIKMNNIERPNIQLKEIPHKTLQTTFSNFKQEINAAISNARQSQIQFTANVVRLFQQLNQFGFE
ncbi:leucine-rich_repeat domain-containing protein [Hexamita inflata]|uniref:Leucine-rich repeat domain-containing protein n=1 Tax=Hexamita inflata TaxID=28002 RepID=A0AA86UYB7_9EUKA|nr:leucine-rich repeat domain-containing protein [Hexamita inflata]